MATSTFSCCDAHVEMTPGAFVLGLGTVEAAVVVFWTDDVHETFAKLAAAGVPAAAEPHDRGNNNRNALVRDPDRNLVELAAKRA